MRFLLIGRFSLLVFYSFLSMAMVHFAAKAPMAPSAASQGARTAPTTPAQAGISSSSFPVSSLTMILVTFPSWISSLTFLMRSSEDTEYSSLTILLMDAPQLGQNFAPLGSSAPHFSQ